MRASTDERTHQVYRYICKDKTHIYAKNHTQDITSLETEVGKLACLFVIDLDSFEEFPQKNCPILYDLAYTYALLKELEDITNKKEQQ